MNMNTNIREEDIVLAPQTEIFDEAKEIAQNTGADEKFPFFLQYDANQKDFLLSVLQTVGAIVEMKRLATGKLMSNLKTTMQEQRRLGFTLVATIIQSL